MENYATLKEALLELYLSVKIRSDEEIDCYTEEQFKEEKRQMRDTDGFTLIDYIKSSIEILMNMKIEDGGGHKGDKENDVEREIQEEIEAEERRRRRKEKKLKKKLLAQKADAGGAGGEAATGMAKPSIKPIPKIDDKTPTSSILDL